MEAKPNQMYFIENENDQCKAMTIICSVPVLVVKCLL